MKKLIWLLVLIAGMANAQLVRTDGSGQYGHYIKFVDPYTITDGGTNAVTNGVTALSNIADGAIVIGAGGAKAVAGSVYKVHGDTIFNSNGEIIFLGGASGYGTGIFSFYDEQELVFQATSGGIYCENIFPVVAATPIGIGVGIQVTGTVDASTAITTDLINSHTANTTVTLGNGTYTTADIYGVTNNSVISRTTSNMTPDTAGGFHVRPQINVTGTFAGSATTARYRGLSVMPSIDVRVASTVTAFRINPTYTRRDAGTINIATWCYNSGAESGTIDSTGKFRISHQIASTTDSVFVIDNMVGGAKYLSVWKQNGTVETTIDTTGNINTIGGLTAGSITTNSTASTFTMNLGGAIDRSGVSINGTFTNSGAKVANALAISTTFNNTNTGQSTALLVTASHTSANLGGLPFLTDMTWNGNHIFAADTLYPRFGIRTDTAGATNAYITIRLADGTLFKLAGYHI